MKRLDKTKWPETRDETPRRFGSRPRRDPRRTGPRPRRWAFWSRRDRDETLVPSGDRDVKTETTSLFIAQYSAAGVSSDYPRCHRLQYNC